MPGKRKVVKGFHYKRVPITISLPSDMAHRLEVEGYNKRSELIQILLQKHFDEMDLNQRAKEAEKNFKDIGIKPTVEIHNEQDLMQILGGAEAIL